MDVRVFSISAIFSSIFHITICYSDVPPNLLLISLDGFRWDYLQHANLSNMHWMISHGAYSVKGLKNAFITKTFPNHYTLVTGWYEENHGIVGNVFYDPVLNKTMHLDIKDEANDPVWYKNGEEPIWVTNQRQDTQHRSGIVMWPGGGPEIRGIKPYRYTLFDKAVTFRQRIDLIIQWFTDPFPINLGLLYYEEPDGTGHKFGPGTPEITQKVQELDADIGYLLQKLEKNGLMSRMNIILTSDHGMTSTPQDEEHRIDLNKHIDFNTYSVDTEQPVATLRPNTPELGSAILKKLTGVTHLHVYKKEDIPEEYHYKHNRRIDPILLIPDEHYWVAYNNSNGTAGNHGYNNSLPSMHPVFIAVGPSFSPGARVEQFSNVDVYPLMCHLLGLKPAPNNGSLDIVAHLLVTDKSGDTSTFGIYMFILIFTGFISGIFGVAACRVHRQYKRRRMMIRSVPDSFLSLNDYTKVDNVPLMSEDSDDEFDVP